MCPGGAVVRLSILTAKMGTSDRLDAEGSPTYLSLPLWTRQQTSSTTTGITGFILRCALRDQKP
jgi:hypothetical protein